MVLDKYGNLPVLGLNERVALSLATSGVAIWIFNLQHKKHMFSLYMKAVWCEECGKEFTVQNYRNIQSVHLKVKYPCHRCGNQFTQQSNLNKHILSLYEGSIFVVNVSNNLQN